MSADVLEHVFEPFFTTKDVGQGSGLGLSMIHGFARQSGGFVTIESQEGEGATVSFIYREPWATISVSRAERPTPCCSKVKAKPFCWSRMKLPFVMRRQIIGKTGLHIPGG